MTGWEQFQERTRYNAILRDFPKKDFQSCLMQFRDMQGRMQCGMAPLKFHPLGKKTMHLSQRDTNMYRTNSAKHHHVQLCSAQIPSAYTWNIVQQKVHMLLEYFWKYFGNKIAENYSIHRQCIRILFQNNVQLQRNILKIF